MKKSMVGLLALVIIVLALVGTYYANALKTKSLANDILSEVNFDKVKVVYVYDRQTSKILNLDKNELDEIMGILKKVELKGVLNTPKTKDEYLVDVGGTGGSFLFTVSEDGFVRIDKKLLGDLLNIIKKQHP